VVDVVEAARRQFAARGIRFIHVEVFQDNDPTRGYNRWMRQWGLASEPWVFLVGRDGRVEGEVRGLGLGGRARRRGPGATWNERNRADRHERGEAGTTKLLLSPR